MTSGAADNTTWALPCSDDVWEQTPREVRDHMLMLQSPSVQQHQQLDTLQQQLDTLTDRLRQTSKTAHKPPSSDSPFHKPQRRTPSGKRGARKGHRGSGPIWLPAPAVHEVYPEACACGPLDLQAARPYHTHQGMELPPIEGAIRHCVLPHVPCLGGGRLRKAAIPPASARGSGPRLTALMGAWAGGHGTSRRLIPDFCQSGLHIPMSLGGMPKGRDRGAQALAPPDDAIASLACRAPVGSIDETPWYCHHTLQWLWTMVTDTVALSLLHPRRSKEACAALLEDGAGILVRDGDGVSPDWVQQRPTCWAHLMRTACGLSAKRAPALAACVAWALQER
jgi:transposase